MGYCPHNISLPLGFDASAIIYMIMNIQLTFTGQVKSCTVLLRQKGRLNLLFNCSLSGIGMQGNTAIVLHAPLAYHEYWVCK